MTAGPLILVVIIVAGLAGTMYLRRLLTGRAVRNVVSLFRARGAISPKRAVAAEEIGLVRRKTLDRMGRFRDYRPAALDLLGRANVVKLTAEGRLYLSEDELASSRLKKFARLD
jgi:hypothetical protein